MTTENPKSHFLTKPRSTPEQQFQEECLSDKGYRFIKWDGSDSLWEFRGSNKTVRVKPDGTVEPI